MARKASNADASMRIVKWCVKDDNEDTREFPTEKDAVEAVLADFAESGSNPVSDIWGEDAQGNVARLSLHWSVKVVEN